MGRHDDGVTGRHPPRSVVRKAPNRRPLVRVLGLLALVFAVAAGWLLTEYGREIGALITHRIGPPPETSPYLPIPHDEQAPVHLAALGDVRHAGEELLDLATVMADIGTRDPYDALLLLGDNAYPDGDPARLEASVFGPFEPLLNGGAQLLAVLGNHDIGHDYGEAQRERLGLPGPWYSTQLNDVTVVALDSNNPDDPVQLQWLDRTLATCDTTWRIAILHHPPYSAGYTGSALEAREAFTPLFEAHGVQLVLSGDDHDYQRSKPINGVTYVVSGGAEITRRTGRRDFTAVAWSTHNFVDLHIYDDHLLLRAVDRDGRVFDEATLLTAS